MKPLWTKPFIVLSLSTFFLCAGFYLLVPTMPLYIKQLGGDESQVGIVMGLFTLSAVVLRPFIGGLVDQLGRRQFVIWGLILFALSMYAYSWVSGIALLLVLRVLHGASWAISHTAIGTAITDNIPDSRRGEGIAWFGLSMTTAMAIGPLLGIWILERHSFDGLFQIAAGLVVLALLGALVTKMPFQKKARTGPIVFFDKSTLSVTVATFFLAFVYGGVVTFLPLFAASIQVNSGTFFLVYAISLTLVRFASGKLSDRFGEVTVIVPGIILTAIAVIVLTFSSGMLGIIIAAFLFGIGFGSAQPALQAATLNLVRPDQKGLANASFATAFDLGIGLGSILLGWVSQWLGYPALFITCGFSAVVSLVLYLYLSKNNTKKLKLNVIQES
ncbi:MFS transporter [Paenibacillus sp. LMG 31456]|uniref:MFS transporter n=1 Tax=Paenibacillus foliorum TaxID=2654974 RepID=A0A972K1J9_9BACL|nr:MFS transporter [Paenibacillus foliorum]NOU96774.1 MFS transporter [Paenibacillus foliorum]